MRFPRRALLLLPCLAFAGLAAFAHYIRSDDASEAELRLLWSRYERIEIGMSPAQVKAVMGRGPEKPTDRPRDYPYRWGSVSFIFKKPPKAPEKVTSWSQGGGIIVVGYVGGQVVSKGFSVRNPLGREVLETLELYAFPR